MRLDTILTEMLPHTVLLGDEIHKVKGAHSKRALRFRGIAEPVRAKEGRAWCFSGTPLQEKEVTRMQHERKAE